MNYFEKLPGDCIYLSPVNADDYEPFCAWYNNRETASLIGTIAKPFPSC